MAYLFLGPEGEYFSWVGTLYKDATKGDLTLTRGGFGPRDLSAAMTGTLKATTADLYLAFEAEINQIDAQSDNPLVQIKSAGTSLLRIMGTNGVFHLEYNNGAGWTAIGDPLPILSDTLTRYDLRCKLDATEGEFAIYMGGTLVESFTGDTIFTAEITVSEFSLETPRSGGAALGQVYFSQIFGMDESSLRFKLKTLPVTGDGVDADFAGGALDIDETLIPEDVDMISSSLAGDKSTFTHAAAGLSPDFDNYSIAAVGNGFRASREATGPQNINSVVKLGATYESTAVEALTLGLAPYFNISTLDPNGSGWIESNLDSAEFGVEAAGPTI